MGRLRRGEPGGGFGVWGHGRGRGRCWGMGWGLLRACGVWGLGGGWWVREENLGNEGRGCKEVLGGLWGDWESNAEGKP